MRALITVSNKDGLLDFARELSKLGVEIISTGGTFKHLEDGKIPVKKISEITDFPEILDGRVKTLHPLIFGGILARGTEEHQKEVKENKIQQIDLVVVNLYPFEETIAKKSSFEDAIENIDIGGPSLIRAAAKNHERVAVIVSPEQYDEVLEDLKKNKEVSKELREKLASEAFERTASYDIAISNYLDKNEFPENLLLNFKKSQDLRYGENKFQKAAFYSDLKPEGSCISNCTQLHGKELSYNNILDMNSAIEIIANFEKPTAAVLKHVNPCGVASHEEISKAFEIALNADKISAFGGVVGLNRNCDLETAKQISEVFIEVVVAPDFEKDALEFLKKKKNLRLLKLNSDLKLNMENFLLKVKGGLLVQSSDYDALDKDKLKTVTKRKPTKEEMNSLLFAWKVCRFVKSNSIVLAKGERTVGIGAGQMSRVDSSIIACRKAGEEAKDSMLASDAFFPFRDAIDVAAEKGIKAIIQPGGSIRDEEVIKAADENDIAMVFTGVRAFRH